MPRSTPTTMIDKSGTITTGGTSQVLSAAKSDRQYILIQNISDTVLWVNFGAAAVADSNSIMLSVASATVAGGSVEFGAHTGVCPNTSVTIIGATTGKKFVAKEA